MSTKHDRVRTVVERIGLLVAERYGVGRPDFTPNALLPRDIEEATRAILDAAETRADEGEDRALPPMPERGARIEVLFRVPKREGRHVTLDAILVEHGHTGLFWVPADDESGVIFTPWRDVEQYTGPKP